MPIFLSAHFDTPPESAWRDEFTEVAERYAASTCSLDGHASCITLACGDALECGLALHRRCPDLECAPSLAIHVGTAQRVATQYIGPAIDHTCLLAAVGAPGQFLVSAEFADIISLSNDVHLRDLGRHQLPDLSAPQRIFQLVHPQLVQNDFPPLRTLSTLPNNLNAQVEPFVGRRKELKALKGYLRSPTHRLLTLIGPGGIGKTSLALQAAARSSEFFADGVFFVGLAALISPELLLSTIVDELALPVPPGQSRRDFLFQYLQERQLLLVLDMFEHLLPARKTVARLLRQAPGVQILTTSREALQLPGERVYQVRGLSYPHQVTGSPLMPFDAVQLFAQAAQRVSPLFALTKDAQAPVARICRSLGGMPLGIKMAATWTRLLSYEEVAGIIERDVDALETSFRDVPPRHRNLRVVFQHSWEMLSSESKGLFIRLTVFQGGFIEEAAAAVAEGTPEQLKELRNKSFLWRSNKGQYHLYASLRQFVVNKDQEEGEDLARLRDRHGRYYMTLVADRGKLLRGHHQREALDELSEAIDNIRAAWNWAIRHDQRELMDKASAATYRLYLFRGYFEEGAALFERAAHTLCGDSSTDRLRMARLEMREAAFLLQLSRLERATALLERSLDLFQELQKPRGQAFTLQHLGRIAYQRGEYSTAQAYFHQSFGWYQIIHDLPGVADLSYWLGKVTYRLAGYKQSRRFYRKSMSICRELGDDRGVANLLVNYAEVDFVMGAYREAQRLYLESMQLCRGYRGKSECCRALIGLGMIAMARGEYRTARQHLEKSLTLSRESGDLRLMAQSLTQLSTVHALMGECEKAQVLGEEALGFHADVEDIELRTLVETFHALNLLMQGDVETAKTYIEHSREMLGKIGDRNGISMLDNVRGRIYLMKGDLYRAQRCYESNVLFNRANGALHYLIIALNGLAAVYFVQQEWICVAKTLREVLILGREINAFSSIVSALELCARVAQARGYPQLAALIWTFLLDYDATYAMLRAQIAPALETLRASLSDAELVKVAQEAARVTAPRLIEQLLTSPILKGACDE